MLKPSALLKRFAKLNPFATLDPYIELATRLVEKSKILDVDIARYYRPLGDGAYEFEIGGKTIRLASVNMLAPPSFEDLTRAAREPVLWDIKAGKPVNPPVAEIPFSHRDKQTPVKNQGDQRATCVAFAAMAQIEAKIKAEQNREVDLSEQFANWLFTKTDADDHCNPPALVIDAAVRLKNHGVCEESLCAYENTFDPARPCSVTPSAEAKEKAVYGVTGYDVIFPYGLSGPSIRNTEYIEAIVANGHDIVVGIEVALIKPDDNGVYDVWLDKYANPLRVGPSNGVAGSVPGHSMLLVGYDKTIKEQPFFIMKNSWGADKGDGGYFKISYDYFKQYARIGYTIDGVRTDMPIDA